MRLLKKALFTRVELESLSNSCMPNIWENNGLLKNSISWRWQSIILSFDQRIRSIQRLDLFEMSCIDRKAIEIFKIRLTRLITSNSLELWNQKKHSIHFFNAESHRRSFQLYRSRSLMRRSSRDYFSAKNQQTWLVAFKNSMNTNLNILGM